MALSEQRLLHFLSRMPFIDSAELAGILGEPHATVHRSLTGLLADGIVGRVTHGTAHLPSSQRYFLTARGIREAAQVLDLDTPSNLVRAYPTSREWLTLLIRRMDGVAAVYCLAASLSPGIDGLRSQVEFHRRGRFVTTITLHDGRSFGVVRQGLALRCRSLYDRMRAIADATPGSDRGPPQQHPVPGPGTCAALTATARPQRAMRHARQGPEMPLTATADPCNAPPLQSHFSGPNVIGTPLQPARRCHSPRLAMSLPSGTP